MSEENTNEPTKTESSYEPEPNPSSSGVEEDSSISSSPLVERKKKLFSKKKIETKTDWGVDNQYQGINAGDENLNANRGNSVEDEDETERLIQDALRKQQGKEKSQPIFKRSYTENKVLKILILIYIFCPLIMQVILRGWVIFLFVLSDHAKFLHWFFFFAFCLVIILAVVFTVVSVLIEEARKIFSVLSTVFSIIFSIFALVEVIFCFTLGLNGGQMFYLILNGVAALISTTGFFVPLIYTIHIFKKEYDLKNMKRRSYD